MRIAICDDELSVLEQLSSLLEEYCAEYDRDVEWEVFQSPLELLSKMEQSGRYDVLFLDILMKDENGIEVAREIRRTDTDVKIVFLTSSSEFAVQSYTVGAFYYQLKPIQKNSLIELMQKLFCVCQKEQLEYFVLKCQNGIHKIDIRQLEYCEVVNRSLILYLRNGTELRSNVKIQEVEEALSRFGCFIRPHRSYLLNLRFVKNITLKSIMMNSGVKIPIPHGKYTQTKERYLEYVFEHMGEMV